jgi:hypothetical protein
MIGHHDAPAPGHAVSAAWRPPLRRIGPQLGRLVLHGLPPAGIPPAAADLDGKHQLLSSSRSYLSPEWMPTLTLVPAALLDFAGRQLAVQQRVQAVAITFCH